jgi:hypothetical protein
VADHFGPLPNDLTKQVREMTMSINRGKAPSHCTDELARKMADLRGPCIGCKDCKGLCRDLLELLMLPDIILTKGLNA